MINELWEHRAASSTILSSDFFIPKINTLEWKYKLRMLLKQSLKTHNFSMMNDYLGKMCDLELFWLNKPLSGLNIPLSKLAFRKALKIWFSPQLLELRYWHSCLEEGNSCKLLIAYHRFVFILTELFICFAYFAFIVNFSESQCLSLAAISMS